ncbi:MAG: hypothetical protein B655_0736 [Methanobacterium sp. Maddingley MBC34]|nr:MAG: hypothetical protein B655_0736 [Methanobacterium sp. Maddingley MBC34]
MVRIITRLDQVKKEQKKHAKPAIDFEMGNVSGKVRAIIAAEEKEFKAGETKPVQIKKININANHICFISAYGTNKYGHTMAVGEETYLPISMERTADHALFAAALDYQVEKDDLLGILILLPVELNF